MSRPPLTPVPYARRTEPTKSLVQGAEYTPAHSTNVARTIAMALVRLEREKRQ